MKSQNKETCKICGNVVDSLRNVYSDGKFVCRCCYECAINIKIERFK